MSILQPNPNIEPLETPAWPTCFTREYRYLGKVSGVLARYLTYLGITVAIHHLHYLPTKYTAFTFLTYLWYNSNAHCWLQSD